MASYRSEILAELGRARFADHSDNHDLGREPPRRGILRTSVTESRARLRRAPRALSRAVEPLRLALRYYLSPNDYFSTEARDELARGEYLYGRLADERSRALLVKLIAHRVLGHRKVRLPRSTPGFWATYEAAGRCATPRPPAENKLRDLALPFFDARPLGYEIGAYSSQTAIARVLGQKQYEYDHGGVRCKAEPGDVVIDAGAGWGDTTLYFAHEAGPQGACVAFEFIPINLTILKNNVAQNPALRDRIRLVDRPLWSVPGKELFYVDWGAESRTSDIPAKHGPADGKALATTIDDTAARLPLRRVDFIKLNVGGAELEALKGAQACLRRYRPKLAISLHHRPEDFTEIPRYIDSLKLGYSLYLEHHSLHQSETVLFAMPPAPEMAAASGVAADTDAVEVRHRQVLAAEPAGEAAMAARRSLVGHFEDQRRPAEAEAIIRDALLSTPDDVEWRLRLATNLLRQGRFAEGWDYYEARRATGAGAAAARLPFPEWRGDPVKSLLVWPEDDLADLLLFSRYLPALRARGIAVTLVCQPALAGLLAPLADEVVSYQPKLALKVHDAWVMIGSLPRLLGTTEATIPPPALTVDTPAGSGVGVSVRGVNSPSAADREWIAARRLELMARPDAVDLDAALKGADSLAAARILAGLAAVACTGGLIAHLAASLGRPTTVLLPSGDIDWRWGHGRSDSAWYPSVTLLRAEGSEPRE